MTLHAMREMTSQVMSLWQQSLSDVWLLLTAWRISLIFGRHTDMAKMTLYTKDRHRSPHIKRAGRFLLNTMTTGWLPWKPIA